MAYYITKDGFRPEQLLGDYYFGNPFRSPLLTPTDKDSPIELSNRIFKFFEYLDKNPELAQKLRELDPEFYDLNRITFYEPQCIYFKVYAERNEYSDFVRFDTLTKYNGIPAFQDKDNGFLVLGESDIEALDSWEETLKEMYEDRFDDFMNSILEALSYDDEEEEEDEDDIDDSELVAEIEKEFLTSHFSPGSIWVDYKDGTLARLKREIEKIGFELERIGIKKEPGIF